MQYNKSLGLFRVAAVTPAVRIADPAGNASNIVRLSVETAGNCCPSVVVFPELSVTGYTCEDLFAQQVLIEGAERAVEEICAGTSGLEQIIIVGCPVMVGARLYNTAIVIRGGRILGIVPKTYIPGSEEFYEKRHFESGARLGASLRSIRYASQQCNIGAMQLFRCGETTFGIELCQDLWVPIPPSTYASLGGAQVIFNLSASNELTGKQEMRHHLVQATSSRLLTGYVYCCCGNGESTDDLVWGGASMIYECGWKLAENELFMDGDSVIVADIDRAKIQESRGRSSTYKLLGEFGPDKHSLDGSEYTIVDCGESADTPFDRKLYRKINPHPFVPEDGTALEKRCREVFEIQCAGLRSRLHAIGCSKCVIGVSGGLDSTLALLVCMETFKRMGLDPKGIYAVTMPCFGTSDRTHDNAWDLMEALGVSYQEINIADAVTMHFKDIGQDPELHDAAYENSQARERTQVLMDLANKVGGIVVGTGDLSELALGWCTYNGDHMSMYGVNAGVPKTLVKEIVRWKASLCDGKTSSTLLDICDTPISPELVPGTQITEDIVGPYELHDFFLKHMREGESPRKILLYACNAFEGVYDKETILKWLRTFIRRFFSQQFKRSCMPNGPKVGSVSLSPRGDWRMSTESSPDLWLADLEES